MARPKKSPDESLTEPLLVRMTLATSETLHAKSLAAGLSPQDYIRALIDDAPMSSRSKVDPLLIVEVNNMNLQLSAIGNNLNQLALATHTGRAFQKFWRDIGLDIKRDLKKARALLNRLLKEV